MISFTSEHEIPVVGLSLNQPYDIMYMQEIPAYLASYTGQTGGQNVQSAIRSIFGEIPITGKLPVDISDKKWYDYLSKKSGIIRGYIPGI
ncbi:MAG: hypothetical protein GXY48_08765 [Methanomicrobiales archaeon]|nr:hypothetical protein [Methanomicrobiales archaeon]